MQRYSNNYTLVPLLLLKAIGGGALLKSLLSDKGFRILIYRDSA